MKRRIHLIDPRTHRSSPDGEPAYWCPVCDRMHVLRCSTRSPGGALWSWNGDFDLPTIGPSAPGEKFSVLYYSDRGAYSYWRLVRPGKEGTLRFTTAEEAARAAPGPEWKAREVKVPAGRHVYCHTYIKEGSIQILSDSERLGGKTVPLPEWEPQE